MRKVGKRAVAIAMAMGISLSGLPVVTYAGEQLGQTNFDDGVGLPWHTCESEPGKMAFEIKDGKYQITIENPGGQSRGGEDRWDCQFRHRGLTIVSGHQYRVEYEITASNSGKYYTKIGNLDGDVEVWHNMSNGYDLDNTWDLINISANQTKKVSVTFTASRSLDVAEWAFHLGGSGQYTNGDCFPVGTVITFDNMSLVDLTSNDNDYVPEEEWKRSDILINQLGYFTGLAKKATLLDDSQKAMEFYLVNESGETVYTGKTVPFGYDEDSQDNVQLIDFSDFDKSGTYTIKTEAGATSKTITIGNTSEYSSLVKDALNYFYQNRSGIKIDSGLVTSGDAGSLARAAGHNPDVATIEQTWGYSATSGTQDVSGGWYDAGDHGKYVVNGGVSLWTMQNQYELALSMGEEELYADGSLNIPENKNGYPDLLDEARWEMEWMFKMLVASGDYQDMVYHKVHDAKWTGLGIAPSEDPQNRIIKPPTTAATLNVSACAAQAARLWNGIDNDFASQCLDIAKRTYEAAKKHPNMYAPLDESVGGGAYGDDNATDEFFWAASELYVTTGDSKYYDDIKSSDYFAKVPTNLGGGEAVDTVGSFDWGNVACLGNLSLSLYKDVTGDAYSDIFSSITAAADAYIAKEKAQGFGLPYGQSTLSYENSAKGYVWGSNSLVVNNSLVLAYAYFLTGNEDYLNGAVGGMDYILGRNAMDHSYVSGYGYNATKYPHHRFWARLIDANYPLAPSGVLSGGPNSGLQDPWVKGLGWFTDTVAPQKAYVDHIEAWSVNECTINWNAPLAWLSAFVTMTQDKTSLMEALSVSRGQYVPGTSSTEDPGKEPSTDKVSDIVPVESHEAPDKITANTQSADNSGNKADNGNSNSNNNNNSNDNSSTNMMPLWIVIIVAVLILLLSTEFFIYKIIMSKNDNKKEQKDDN